MSLKVIVEDNNIDLALQQLHNKYYFLQASRWYKKRYGYYEKPSVLKRKKRKMKAILCHQYIAQTCYFPIQPTIRLWLKIDLAQQYLSLIHI